MNTRRRMLVIVMAVLAVFLGALHVNYPLTYVYNVMVDQGPDYYDFKDFPASVIEPADAPVPLRVDPSENIVALMETHPDIDDATDFLRATDTTAFLIVHNGRLIFEQYGLGHTAESVENTFSVSKSIVSALIGLAAEDGSFSVDEPITDYLPELGERDARFEQITIKHLLDMKSGIAYSRDIVFPIVNNDDPLVYYHPDLESVVLERTEIDSDPGSFQYNNYNPPLLGLILRRTTGASVSDYLGERIWQPMGAAQPAGWTTDEQGMERMESGFHARARDLARFGLLYLDEGRAGGRQIVPQTWVRSSTDTTEHIELKNYDGRRWGYHAGWWIVPRPLGRSDYCAIGHFGQFIYISPQYNAVFVRNGPGRGEWGDRDWTGVFYYLAERLAKAADSES